MPIVAVPVTIQASLITGLPAGNGRVYFDLNAADVVSGPDGGIVIPQQVEVILDANGEGLADLFVNDTGLVGSMYLVDIYDEAGIKAGHWTAVIPPAPCLLHDVINLTAPPTVDGATAAMTAAQAAAAQAQTFAAQAEGFRDATAAIIRTQYVHEQGVPSDEWTVNHSLGKYPSVTVEDSTGEEVEGSIFYDTLDSLRIVFSAAFSGRAILN